MAEIIKGEAEDGKELSQNEFEQPTENDKSLVEFVNDHCNRWRDYRDVNWLPDWQEYERLFRGIWADEDKTRESERSRIVTPATQQAIETRHGHHLERPTFRSDSAKVRCS